MTELFHTDSGTDRPVRGLIGKESLFDSAFQRDGVLEFYARRAENENWWRIGSLRKPAASLDFPKIYSVTLDAEGFLRLHIGMVPYWKAPMLEMLKSTPGCVYR